jgi:hypothetical protein
MNRTIPPPERHSAVDGGQEARRFIRRGCVVGLVVGYAMLVPLKLCGMMPELDWWRLIFGPIGLFGALACASVVPIGRQPEGGVIADDAPRGSEPPRIGFIIVVVAVIAWGGFLPGWFAIGPDSGIVQEVVAGSFGPAVLIATMGAGAAIWAAYRTRRPIAMLATMLFLPVCLLGWWRMLTMS